MTLLDALRRPTFLALAGTTFVLLIDLLVPLGVAFGILYAALLFLLEPYLPARSVVLTAFCGCAYTLLALAVQYDPPVAWQTFANRGLTVLVTAGSAVWLIVRKRATERLERASAAHLVALEDSRSRSESLLNTAHDAIVVANEAGTIETWNPAAEKLFGWTSTQAIGKDISLIIPPALHRAHRARLRRFKSTGRERVLGRVIEFDARHRNGREIPVDLALTTWTLDGSRYFSGVLRDTSDRRAAIAMEIEQARLETRNRELEQFAFVASHDLQEPVCTIGGLTGMLRANYSDVLDETAEKTLGYISHAVERMEKLISGLLAHNQLGTNGEHAPVELGTLLATVTDDLADEVASSGAVVEVGELPTVVGDRTDLTLLFHSLIGNAVKFARPDVTPRVDVSALRMESGWSITVADNGRGIAPEHLEDVFLMFKRLHTRDEIPGNGLGLTHCEKIMGQHGGSMEVESELGTGSTFIIHFPGVPNGSQARSVDR